MSAPKRRRQETPWMVPKAPEGIYLMETPSAFFFPTDFSRTGVITLKTQGSFSDGEVDFRRDF